MIFDKVLKMSAIKMQSEEKINIYVFNLLPLNN